MGDERFDAGRPHGPTITMDGNAQVGPSPFDTLLCALGSCAAVDVVEILAKRRTPVQSLRVEVVAKRVDGVPRRLEHAVLHFDIVGDGIERVHAERAVELSVSKYCSVRDSLRPDAPVTWRVTVNGDAPATVNATA
jgi:putative redox protein